VTALLILKSDRQLASTLRPWLILRPAHFLESDKRAFATSDPLGVPIDPPREISFRIVGGSETIVGIGRVSRSDLGQCYHLISVACGRQGRLPGVFRKGSIIGTAPTFRKPRLTTAMALHRAELTTSQQRRQTGKTDCRALQLTLAAFPRMNPLHNSTNGSEHYWQTGNGGDGLNFLASDADKRHQVSAAGIFSILELFSTSSILDTGSATAYPPALACAPGAPSSVAPEMSPTSDCRERGVLLNTGLPLLPPMRVGMSIMKPRRSKYFRST